MTANGTSVLVVDDDDGFRGWFRRSFAHLGCTLRTAENIADARALLEEQPAELAFVDFNLPDGTGDELIRWALQHKRIEGAFCMTAFADCRNVVAAMRAGAIDVFEKAIDLDRLAKMLAQPRSQPNDDFARWRRTHAADIIGTNELMVELLQVVQRVSRASSTVLIHGESGTGKEQIANAIHSSSPRKSKPFVAINCAAIPETLIESELFGHAKGAFTGAQSAREGRIAAADGGTLFLDEIGDMPLQAQAKLLRVLQERCVTPVGADRSVPVDVRIVAATHRDLEAMVEAGQFRQDLYYRLSVIRLEMPALRERKDDVIPIARFLVARLGGQIGVDVNGFDESAEAALLEHDWPGNVRELSNAVERALVLRSSGMITAKDLQLPRSRRNSSTRAAISQNTPAYQPPPAPPPTPAAPAHAAPPAAASAFPSGAGDTTRPDLNLRTALDQVERQMIDEALARTGGNRTEAAALLGLNRSTLVEKIRKLAG